MNRAEKAIEIKHSGLNCCQAVIAAFSDVIGITQNDAMRLGSCFGAGMGGTKGTCGALVGAQAVYGMKMFNGRPLTSSAREIFDSFETKCGATICRDIKGLDTGRMLCSCDDCVYNAAQILESMLLLTTNI